MRANVASLLSMSLWLVALPALAHQEPVPTGTERAINYDTYTGALLAASGHPNELSRWHGIWAYDNGRFDEARRHFERAAGFGDKLSQHFLTLKPETWDTIYGLVRSVGPALWQDKYGPQTNIATGGPVTIGKIDPRGIFRPNGPKDVIAGFGLPLIPPSGLSVGKRFLFVGDPHVQFYLHLDKDALQHLAAWADMPPAAAQETRLQKQEEVLDAIVLCDPEWTDDGSISAYESRAPLVDRYHPLLGWRCEDMTLAAARAAYPAAYETLLSPSP